MSSLAVSSADLVAERDHWIRLFNRLEGAVAHHKTATSAFREVHDEALYAAHERVLRDACLSGTAAQSFDSEGRAR